MVAGLITVAHGTRRKRGEEGVAALSRAAGGLLGAEVTPAYLDFQEPDPVAAARAAAAAGHERVVLAPLLFTSAFHLTSDLPKAAERARKEAGVDVEVAEPIGTGDDVARLLAGVAAEDAEPGAVLALYSVGSSSRGATEAVGDLAKRVGRRAGRECLPIQATGRNAGGTAALDEVSREFRAAHLLPLFVTDGRLLDEAAGHVAQCPEGECRWGASPALGTRLARLVAGRFRSALSITSNA